MYYIIKILYCNRHPLYLFSSYKQIPTIKKLHTSFHQILSSILFLGVWPLQAPDYKWPLLHRLISECVVCNYVIGDKVFYPSEKVFMIQDALMRWNISSCGESAEAKKINNSKGLGNSWNWVDEVGSCLFKYILMNFNIHI